MASLIKTNKISTPGGEEFTLPTTLPSAQSSLTSTSGGQLGYGDLGFSSDAMVKNTAVVGGATAFQQSEILMDKARVKNDATAAAVELDLTPSLRTGQTNANVQSFRINYSGVCFSSHHDFYPAIQLYDSSNTALISGSGSSQAYRWRSNYSGGYNNYSTDPNDNYMHLYASSSYRPTGASTSSELFNVTSREDGRAFLNGFAEFTIVNSAITSIDTQFGVGGAIQCNMYTVYRYQSSKNNTDNNCTIGNFGVFAQKKTSMNNAVKIKFYSGAGGSAVMNEGLFWTETYMNPYKT